MNVEDYQNAFLGMIEEKQKGYHGNFGNNNTNKFDHSKIIH
jgi:hypothetical protein